MSVTAIIPGLMEEVRLKGEGQSCCPGPLYRSGTRGGVRITGSEWRRQNYVTEHDHGRCRPNTRPGGKM